MTSTNQVHQQSFSNLPIYFHNLEKTYEGTITAIKTDHRKVFEVCFVGLACTVQSFVGDCFYPVIFLHSIPIRGNYFSSLYIAVGMDGNRQLLPIAYGVGVKQNTDRWCWFLIKLKECIGNGTKVAFIHNVELYHIQVALSDVFPDSDCGFGCESVYKEYQRFVGRGVIIEALFKNTCRCYTTHQFENKLASLYYVIDNAVRCNKRRYLDDLGHEKWARALFPRTRTNILDVGIPDEIKLLSILAREYPIISFLEEIRNAIQRIYVERSEHGGALFGPLTPHAETVIRRRIMKSLSWEATCISESNMFLVKDSCARFTIDIADKSCTCGKWQHNAIPCVHALTVFRFRNMLSNCSMDCADYVTTTTYRRAYQTGMAHQLPLQDQWEIPMKLMTVLPPHV